MKTSKMMVVVVVLLLAPVGATADITIETVPVGNPGNTGELSGNRAGGIGPDRICGAVAYEYNIGKYEVTAGQYKDFLNAMAKTDTYGLYNASMNSHAYGCQITRNGTSGNYTYDFSGRPSGSGTEADWANRPVNYVSWYDTLRFVNWMTNGQGTGSTESGSYTITGGGVNAGSVTIPTATERATWSTGANSYFLLTSEDEWYKAAYHDKNAVLAATYFDYPTSSNSMPSNDLTSPDGGNNANFYQGGYTIGSPYYRTPVGEFELSDSPYGTFDQGGNVWEWNESILYDGSSRGLRGGSFNNNAGNLRAADRYDINPTNEYNFIGFRVSEVPEPASMAVLALGSIGMLLRRRGLRR